MRHRRLKGYLKRYIIKLQLLSTCSCVLIASASGVSYTFQI